MNSVIDLMTMMLQARHVLFETVVSWCNLSLLFLLLKAPSIIRCRSKKPIGASRCVVGTVSYMLDIFSRSPIRLFFVFVSGE